MDEFTILKPSLQRGKEIHYRPLSDLPCAISDLPNHSLRPPSQIGTDLTTARLKSTAHRQLKGSSLRLTLSAGNSVSCMFSHLPLLFFRPPSWLPRSPIVTRDALRCSSACLPACARLLCSIFAAAQPSPSLVSCQDA